MTLMCFFLSHSFVSFVVSFGSLSCWNQGANSAKSEANQEVAKIAVPPHSLGAGFKKEQFPIDSHVKKTKFRAKINMFTARFNKTF